MGQDLVTNVNGDIQAQMQWAKLASTADILPEAYRNKPADILVAVGFGASMGLSFSDSLFRVNVIKGKPTMSAELVSSQVRKAGHKLRISKDIAKTSVTVTIIRADDPDYPFSVTRDMAWAHQMGLDTPNRNGTPSNYQKQPMTMLTWRAITACAREACPEALYGAGYTPDEVQESETIDQNKPVEPEPIVAQVVTTPEQRKQLFAMLQKNGVDSSEKAKLVLTHLAGKPVGDLKDVADDDILLWLENPEMVATRTAEALVGVQ